MARMPGAEWRPITVNYRRGGQEEVRGVVVHIMAGTLTGTDAWFRNPSAEASSHFGTSRAGALRQWVDTADRAWAQADGNRTWLSVENEGHGGDALTAAQLDACARVLAWAHQKHGVPLKVASGPADRGLGWHGMGGKAWGNHPDCPGRRIVAQLDDIVQRAAAIVSPKPAPKPKPSAPPFPGRGYFRPGMVNAHVTRLGERLVQRGYGQHYSRGPGPRWTDADRNAVRAFQRAQGWTGADADGYPGPETWRRLFT